MSWGDAHGDCLVAAVRQNNRVGLLNCVAESFVGRVELNLEAIRRLPQIVAPLDRSLREGWISELDQWPLDQRQRAGLTAL